MDSYTRWDLEPSSGVNGSIIVKMRTVRRWHINVNNKFTTINTKMYANNWPFIEEFY
jgi:hypothetical protein